MVWGRAVALAITGLAMARPAAAHWDYTRWGMSVEAVKAATKGKAAANSDRDLDGTGFKTLLTAPHAWGRIRMRADFRFRDEDGKLNAVGLRPLDGRDCDAIRAELNKRHGREVAMPYWTAPESALDDPDEMTVWARKAYQAAIRAGK